MNKKTSNPQKYIIRTDRAGVFFAEITDRRGSEIDLANARRIHYWNGASECIQLSQEGYNKEGRMTMAIPSMTVLGVIEVLPCTESAAANLEAKPIWKL